MCYFGKTSLAQTVLVKNNDHIITYSFSGENIIFTLEDINDPDNNVWNDNGPRGYCWQNYNTYCFNKLSAPSVSYGTDASLIEIDFDLNNKIEGGKDKGFYINKKEGANAHWLDKDFSFLDNDARDRANKKTVISDSKSTAYSKWTTSQYLSKQHPVFIYTIPLSEIMDFEKMKINLRFMFLRSTGTTDKPFGPKYTPPNDKKHYFYPDGDFCNPSSKLFIIDFNNSTDEVVKNLKKKFEDEKVKQLNAKEDASSSNKLYSIEVMKKSTTTLPKYDGVFIKLKNGKYVEVIQQKLFYGVIRLATKGRVIYLDDETSKQIKAGGYNPYYLQSVFETLQIIQIQKSDFINFSVVASSYLKTDVDFLSFHPVKLYPLSPLPEGKYFLFPCDYGEYTYNRNSFVWTGKVIEGVNFYWFDSKIQTERSPGDSWSYSYKVTQPLDIGYYGLWANKNIWIFQIIPDQPKSNNNAKSINKPNSGANTNKTNTNVNKTQQK